jgi:hypothetical protein
MDKQIILNFLKENKPILTEKYDVVKIGLFGSYAAENQTEISDIDIIVSMPSDFDKFYDLKDFLETNLKHKIDLGLEKNMRDLIKKSIEKEIIYV